MPFPEVKRVIYQKNPLDEVVCQLRFPPILKIETEIPAEFQERIRGEFPNYSEGSNVNIPPEKGSQIPLELLGKLLPKVSNKNHKFASEDGLWTINLTRDFIALTANAYERWEQFQDKLRKPLKALIGIYSIPSFSRIGLRYIDVIRRSTLGINGEDWTKLLKPHFLGLLGPKETNQKVLSFESAYEILLSDEKSRVRIRTKFVRPVDADEVCYMIDSDFYNTDKTDTGNANKKLGYFHKRASRLLRWCITDYLHELMGPKEI